MNKKYLVSYLYNGEPKELTFRTKSREEALDAFYEEIDEHFAETGINPDALSDFVAVRELNKETV